MAVAQSYKVTEGLLCDGHPKVTVGSMTGTCLGLVADSNLKDQKLGRSLLFPRKIVEIEKNRFIITDMGGWSPANRGSLWELDVRGKKPELHRLITGLYLPHDIELGPDGNIYVGELGKITRYNKQDVLNRKNLVAQIVVDQIPSNLTEKNMHPLVNFAFGKSENDQWNLYVNIGAPDDACIESAPYKCALGDKHGLIRKYQYLTGINSWSPRFEAWAQGLRNSMGLVSHSSGVLLQVENSRDFRDVNEPYDELNVVEKGKHYGWPYCYNFQATSPEWKNKVNCEQGFQSPLVLLPPHSAPLDILYYEANLFPELKNHLLISYHGYRPTGSRVVAIPSNNLGLPEFFEATRWDRQKPDGGVLRATNSFEVLMNWSKSEGVRPSGAPVGLTVAHDGSIWVVEDKNKTILRLALSDTSVVTEPVDSNQQAELLKKVRVHKAIKKLNENQEMLTAYNWINQNVFQSSCTACHSDLQGSGTEAFEFMIAEEWITPGSEESLLNLRLRGSQGLQKMPLGGQLPEEYIQYIEKFVESL